LSGCNGLTYDTISASKDYLEAERIDPAGGNPYSGFYAPSDDASQHRTEMDKERKERA